MPPRIAAGAPFFTVKAMGVSGIRVNLPVSSRARICNVCGPSGTGGKPPEVKRLNWNPMFGQLGGLVESALQISVRAIPYVEGP